MNSCAPFSISVWEGGGSVSEGWLCIVLSKSLCMRGAKVALKEVKRLAGDSYIDFRVVDVGFDGDCYAFVKCRIHLGSKYLENFRASHYVISVLSSYDSPTYLPDDEVEGFVVLEDEEVPCLSYGDAVMVGGDGVFSGLNGVVIFHGCEECCVMFRFHTVTIRQWITNSELSKTGSVFERLKLPVSDATLIRPNKKYPVRKMGRVSTGKLDRLSNRED